MEIVPAALKERLSRSKRLAERIVEIEPRDKLTDPQIVAKVEALRDRSLRRLAAFNHTERNTMSVARVTEITSSSSKSFDEALRAGLARANKTLENVAGAWIKDHEVIVKNGEITEYRVRMKITFVLND